MKKNSKIAFLIICCLLAGQMFTGCSRIFNREPRVPDSSTKAGKLAKTEVLFELFNNEDLEGLKALLCVRTQELYDIEEQILRAFELVEGNIISFDGDVSGSGGESIRNGVTTMLDESWYMDAIETDAGKHYEIRLHEYIIYKEDTNTVGITHMIITCEDGDVEDWERVEIGYEWTTYTSVAKKSSYDIVKALGDSDMPYMRSYLSERTLELDATKAQIKAAFFFISGTPILGEVTWRGKQDIETTIVSQDLVVENHEMASAFFVIQVDNIKTSTGQKYTMEYYTCFENIYDETLIGASQIIITNSLGLKCIIGEKI